MAAWPHIARLISDMELSRPTKCECEPRFSRQGGASEACFARSQWESGIQYASRARCPSQNPAKTENPDSKRERRRSCLRAFLNKMAAVLPEGSTCLDSRFTLTIATAHIVQFRNCSYCSPRCCWTVHRRLTQILPANKCTGAAQRRLKQLCAFNGAVCHFRYTPSRPTCHLVRTASSRAATTSSSPSALPTSTRTSRRRWGLRSSALRRTVVFTARYGVHGGGRATTGRLRGPLRQYAGHTHSASSSNRSHGGGFADGGLRGGRTATGRRCVLRARGWLRRR